MLKILDQKILKKVYNYIILKQNNDFYQGLFKEECKNIHSN